MFNVEINWAQWTSLPLGATEAVVTTGNDVGDKIRNLWYHTEYAKTGIL